jgi:hypothetical protein
MLKQIKLDGPPNELSGPCLRYIIRICYDVVVCDIEYSISSLGEVEKLPLVSGFPNWIQAAYPVS